MAAGAPLDDADREPWLDAVAGALAERHRQGRPVVASCSALRRRHRDRLRSAAPVRFVWLDVDVDELERRTRGRDHAFMPASLLDSQLAALEPLGDDEVDDVVVEVAGADLDAVVDRVVDRLDRGG
jgi:gluconokinase